jgi:excisionase family DNA binding protein
VESVVFTCMLTTLAGWKIKTIKMEQLLNELKEIRKLIHYSTSDQDQMLTVPEAALYIKRSVSNLYKLTSGKQIPYYCPSGKKIYFKRSDLDEWLLKNKVFSQDELGQQAKVSLCRRQGGKL